MDLKDLKKQFASMEQIENSANELQLVGAQLQWKGLVGSSRALCAAGLTQQVPGNHLFILNDKEEAAYFLNDLEGIFPNDNHVLFYPASYRVPYQFEEVDNANVVARAQVLEKINNGKNNFNHHKIQIKI
jgi:transcription-repair coupling factor (superfamily II helicase)